MLYPIVFYYFFCLMRIKSVFSFLLLSLMILGAFWVNANLELWTSLITATVVNLNASLLKIQASPSNKAEIIQGFCNALSSESTAGLSTSDEVYDASQSLFLYLLCNNNKIQTPFFQQQIPEYIKMDSFRQLTVNKACYKEYSEECNVVELWDQLMNELFSELFTIKQAEIFWLSQLTLLDKNLLLGKINSFAKEKFWIERFCDDLSYNYSKTCNIMQRDMKAFIPRVSNLKIINAEKLYALAKNKKANEDLEDCTSGSDFLLCGTLGETTNGLKPFISLIYNELARHTIFMTYYTTFLNQRNSLTDSIKDEIKQYVDNQTKLFFLTNQTLSDLISLARTYPIHIGMLAYQEDLLRFRNDALSKIITPFYTLYHKLRNVQTNS